MVDSSARVLTLVIDTNIWLDMLVFDDPRTQRLAALLQAPARPQALASEEMRAELADVISRPQFRLEAAGQSGGEVVGLHGGQALARAQDAVAAGDGLDHHLRGHGQGAGELLGRLVEQVGAFEELLLDTLFDHESGIIVSSHRRPLVTS